MKKLLGLILATALCVGCSTTRSFSADIPVKAPVKTLSFLDRGYTGNGAYFGLYTEAGGGSVNGSVAGVPSGSLTSTGGAVGLVGGYAWTAANGNAFVAVEAGFGWQNFNGNTAGFALSGPASFYQDVKIGTPLSNILSLLPNNPFGNLAVPPLPILPAGVVATNVHPYFSVGMRENQNVADALGITTKAWRIAPTIGLGAVTQLSNTTAVDTFVKMTFPEKGVCTALGDCGNFGNQVMAGVKILY